MAVKVNIGGEFFDELRSRGCYYVDKTALLFDLVNAENAVTLFTRPRRFGKTLMMTMIQSFFDIRRDSREVFRDLEIMQREDFCREWMNQYPVLFITLKDAEGLTFDSAYGMLASAIADLCKRHAYLRSSSLVLEEDKDAFNRLIGAKASSLDIRDSLRTLTRMMYAHYGKPVILLIDEYDVPLAKASETGEAGERYYPQMLEVIRGLMSTALKSNDCLKFAVVTGCLKIAKESIFTGVNNFASYSVLDDAFSRYFGFTQKELDALLKAADLEEKSGTFKAWYDGYVFGCEAVYCPWDVINYTAALLYKKTAKPKNYWKNTSGNGIIRAFVERSDFPVQGKFETLLNGGSITQAVSDELTYDMLHLSEENLWSVLLMTGYLTKADLTEEGDSITLRIPNAEIAGIFQETVVRYFTDHLDDSEQKAMMAALWSGDEEAASKAITGFLRRTISYMDYHEDYYHAFLAGIFVGRGYEVYSNQESGNGRPDIVLIDYQKYRVLIIEAKKSNSRESMQYDCQDALNQIVQRDYAAKYEDYDEVLCYGIAFYQKSALVKKQK